MPAEMPRDAYEVLNREMWRSSSEVGMPCGRQPGKEGAESSRSHIHKFKWQLDSTKNQLISEKQLLQRGARQMTPPPFSISWYRHLIDPSSVGLHLFVSALLLSAHHVFARPRLPYLLLLLLRSFFSRFTSLSSWLPRSRYYQILP